MYYFFGGAEGQGPLFSSNIKSWFWTLIPNIFLFLSCARTGDFLPLDLRIVYTYLYLLLYIQ